MELWPASWNRFGSSSRGQISGSPPFSTTAGGFTDARKCQRRLCCTRVGVKHQSEDARHTTPVFGDPPHKERALPTGPCTLARKQGTPIHRDAYSEESFRSPYVRTLRCVFVCFLQFNCAMVCLSIWKPCSIDSIYHARCAVPIQGNGH